MTRMTISKLALLLAMAGALALAGCGGSGSDGESGPAGMAGAVGPQGPAGAKGDPGEMGPAGPQGEMGPAGPQGEPGMAGADGMDGEDGMDGMAGPAGPAGPMGPQGEKGEPGEAAEAGATVDMVWEEIFAPVVEAEFAAMLSGKVSVTRAELSGYIEAIATKYGGSAPDAATFVADKFPGVFTNILPTEAVAAFMEWRGANLMGTRDRAAMVLEGEMGDQGEPGEDGMDVDSAELMALKDRIAALETKVGGLETGKADVADPVGLPSLTGASVLTRNTTILSRQGNTYDVSLVDITATAGSSAAKGSYAGKAMTGFGGLDVTAAGSNGANIRGSWLKYGHWGIIDTLGGGMAVFSVGEAMGANPAPMGGQMSATWTGDMVGSWNPVDIMDDADTADVDESMMTPAVAVRGTAMINVAFTQTASGAEASAGLTISGLSGGRGMFRPGEAQADTVLMADPNSLNVWTGMKIMAGNFARHDFNRHGGPDGSYDASETPAAGTVEDDIHDRAGDTRYLAGSFYGPDGMEVGGVFMENGQVSGSDNAFGPPIAANTEDPTFAADTAGTLTGAFGAARVIP